MLSQHSFILRPVDTLHMHANIVIQGQNPRNQMMTKTFPTAADLQGLSRKLEKLSSFKANILRTSTMGAVDWERKDGRWEGGVQEGKGVPNEMVGAPQQQEQKPGKVIEGVGSGANGSSS